jgi:hypothetical protein
LRTLLDECTIASEEPHLDRVASAFEAFSEGFDDPHLGGALDSGGAEQMQHWLEFHLGCLLKEQFRLCKGALSRRVRSTFGRNDPSDAEQFYDASTFVHDNYGSLFEPQGPRPVLRPDEPSCRLETRERMLRKPGSAARFGREARPLLEAGGYLYLRHA